MKWKEENFHKNVCAREYSTDTVVGIVRLTSCLLRVSESEVVAIYLARAILTCDKPESARVSTLNEFSGEISE